MCGILGISNNSIDLVKDSIGLLTHRGPDYEGLYCDEEVSLGHRRLSIIDLTSGSNQPMVSEDGDYVIVFNGEIYNFAELRNDLEKSGVIFKTNGDTEVILNGYIHQGIDFFSLMRGMWALAIYDKKKSSIILSRDYFGIKPLYYGLKDSDLVFASEIKVLKNMYLGQKINSKYYYQFFNLGYFIAPHTQYADIFKMKPGEIIIWSIDDKKIKSKQINITGEDNHQFKELDEQEVSTIVENSLRDSLQAHFVSDVPVGILLSGGNDSSLLVALAKELGKNPTAYHLSIKGSSDTYYADKVAKHLNIPYQSIEMDQDLLDRQYHKLIDILDEPTGDVSIIPTSLIYSLINKQTKVVLSGEGGDELFGGYLRHNVLLKHSKVTRKNLTYGLFSNLMSTSSYRSISLINPFLARIRNILNNKINNDVIGVYLQQVKIVDFPIAPNKIRDDLYQLWHDKTVSSPASLFFDIAMYLPNNLMYKNDIASMFSSIEARVPFLDKVFYNSILKINDIFRLSPRYQSKKILKNILLKYLPVDLVVRNKKGFGFNFLTYHKELFLRDLKEALVFHRNNADKFGLDCNLKTFIADSNCEIILKKYPRFAFALVTNWKLMAKAV